MNEKKKGLKGGQEQGLTCDIEKRKKERIVQIVVDNL